MLLTGWCLYLVYQKNVLICLILHLDVILIGSIIINESIYLVFSLLENNFIIEERYIATNILLFNHKSCLFKCWINRRCRFNLNEFVIYTNRYWLQFFETDHHIPCIICWYRTILYSYFYVSGFKYLIIHIGLSLFRIFNQCTKVFIKP